jgi:hypothetical protein
MLGKSEISALVMVVQHTLAKWIGNQEGRFATRRIEGRN